jgi:hypothetical protein
MFRNEATDTLTVPVQQVEMKTERVAIAYRLLFAYPFVRPESEQNSSHLQIDCDQTAWSQIGSLHARTKMASRRFNRAGKEFSHGVLSRSIETG